MNIEALDHVGLAVADMGRSVQWYQQVLGLQRAYQDAWGDYPAVLEKNGSGVALFPASRGPIEPSTFESLAHVGFRVSRQGYEEASAGLTAAGIEFRDEPPRVRWRLRCFGLGHDYRVTLAS
jgi:catechol 2,3-dioxygenase-like lactoylglutathione lyase family enzyme